VSETQLKTAVSAFYSVFTNQIKEKPRISASFGSRRRSFSQTFIVAYRKMDFLVVANALSKKRAPHHESTGTGKEHERFISEGGVENHSFVYAWTMWVWTWVAVIVGIILSVIAVYLSWTCSTAQNQHVLMKVALAILAALFSVVYIIVHFILVFVTDRSDGRIPKWCSSGIFRRSIKRR
jgi:ABC-type Fe3+ transport system permease subunit